MILSTKEGSWVVRQVANACRLPIGEISYLFEVHVSDVRAFIAEARRKFQLPELEIYPPYTVKNIVQAIRETRRRRRVKEWLVAGPLTALYGRDGARLEHLQLVSLTTEQVRAISIAATKRFRVRLDVLPVRNATPHELVIIIAATLP